MPPGANVWPVIVAFSPQAVETTPRLFGPTMRIPYRRAAASSSSCRRAPSAPVSAKPDEITTALRTPAAPHRVTASTASRAGQAMTARSGRAGEVVDADEPGERLAEVGEDPPTWRRGVVAGSDHHHVRRVDDRAQRADDRLPVAQVGVVLEQGIGGQVELDLDDPVLEPHTVDQSDRVEHAQHGGVGGQGLGDEPAEPGRLGDQRQILQQHGGDALVVVGVGDGEGDLGVVGSGRGVVLADADEDAGGLGDEGDLDVDVVHRGSFELVVGDEPAQGEEPQVCRPVVELAVERPQAVDIGRCGRAHADRPARRQQHVALERREERLRRDRSFVSWHTPSSGRCTWRIGPYGPGRRRPVAHTVEVSLETGGSPCAALVYHGPGRRGRRYPNRRSSTTPTPSSASSGDDLRHRPAHPRPDGPGPRPQSSPRREDRKPGDRVLVSCITACGVPLLPGGQLGQCLGAVAGSSATRSTAPRPNSCGSRSPTRPLTSRAAGVTDEQLLMLADILPTGYEVGVLNGQVRPGDVVAVVGAGPIGLSVMMGARLYNPSHVVAIDLVDSRLDAAKQFGADVTVNNGREDAAGGRQVAHRRPRRRRHGRGRRYPRASCGSRRDGHDSVSSPACHVANVVAPGRRTAGQRRPVRDCTTSVSTSSRRPTTCSPAPARPER